MMQVLLGESGLGKSYQQKFKSTTTCRNKDCKKVAHIAFVAHEMPGKDQIPQQLVCTLHKNDPDGDFWLHDAASFAVYICRDCGEATTLYTQA